MQNNNDYLRHYGVLGMKWGRRKSSPNTRDNNKKMIAEKTKNNNLDREIREKRKKDSKYRRLLSDKELTDAINRLTMEKRLKELTEQDLSPGKSKAKNILSTSGDRIFTALATGAGLYAVKAIMENKFDIKEMASYMTPKPKNK